MTRPESLRRRFAVRASTVIMTTGLVVAAAGCSGPVPPHGAGPDRAPSGQVTAALSPSPQPSGPQPTRPQSPPPDDAVTTPPASGSPTTAPPTQSPSASPSPSRTYPHVPARTAPTHIGGHPVVYLTYDDGPVPAGTPRVLAALAKHHAVATFFVMGYLSARYPQLLRDEAAAGMAIGNHTWSHKNLTQVSDQQVDWQLRSTSKAIQAAVGVAPTCMRPPYGAVDDRVRYLASEQGMTAWLWNNDWTNGSSSALKTWPVAKAANRIVANLRPGSVVLMHDGETNGPKAAQMTSRVLKVMAARGWRTATLCPPASPGATAPAVGGPG